ncbi:MAG TPA: hypothetical protein VJY54_14530 [Lachnospiraceae bacterium]|nr:hypothetical protein [Lachnospiraceae bacterium]
MILHILNQYESGIKNGVYYFGLREYPEIQNWEWNSIIAFLSYEKSQGRTTEIICEDNTLLLLINLTMSKIDGTEYIPPVEESIEKFVYHATNATAAGQILACGSLLSATKVYKKTGEEIALNRRESGWEDSADFYEYIMFGWGEHLVGDYVVLCENWPNEEDLNVGNFDAGVRFYFLYEELLRHPGHTFDGYHVIKVKEEIKLSDYLFACIVPEQYKSQIEKSIPPELSKKVFYLSQKGMTLTNWNCKVVEFVNKLNLSTS